MRFIPYIKKKFNPALRGNFRQKRDFHLAHLMAGLIILMLAGCSKPTSAPEPATALLKFTASPSPSQTASPIPTASRTPTITPTSSATLTPTTTDTPTITPTPTPDYPHAIAIMRAFCRYGPGKAYLYSHELKTGDHAEVHGRNSSASWLWLKPDNLERHCWAAASVLQVEGDPRAVPVVRSRLPHSTLYGPPQRVEAYRDGDQVTITWSRVWMTADDDRGYLIEATVCQGGVMIFVAVQTYDNSYTLTDEENCSGTSSGLLYTVEKHGYTDPIEIPWP